MNLLLEGIVARTQRYFRVEVCHIIWMGNHVHILVVPHDTQDCIDFYQEIQKKVTETIKRLLGEEYMHLWEGDAVVMEIGDVDAAIEKIAYIYANPARANLVDTIGEYPGVSSWREYKDCGDSVDYTACRTVPWVQLPMIACLTSRALHETADRKLASKLGAQAKLRHTLSYSPNAWMKAFGVKAPAEVRDINQRVMKGIELKESEARRQRRKSGFSLIGADSLRRQPVMKPHTPKARKTRMFIYTKINELRMEYIRARKEFCELCRQCFLALRAGNLFPPLASRGDPTLPTATGDCTIESC